MQRAGTFGKEDLERWGTIDDDPVRLNLGCGSDLRDGYLNCDFVAPNAIGHFQLVDLNARWPFPDESVDEILMWHVLEHLRDTDHVLSEAKRVLKRGGIFWGQVPHGNTAAARFHPQHYRQFVAHSFVTMADLSGLSLVKASPIGLSNSIARRARNLIPEFMRRSVCDYVPEMMDAIDFEFLKGTEECS